ncbi:MAG: LysR family transcriptional regulator [Actinobacteria bacterium]|nr:LysR family transcriptional regulator [Actinomycetota bacterium]
MELRQLEHFVTVAEERHFTRAAELLQISQSGLSASIRSLEQELGTSLFIRSTRRVELTTAGQALLADSVRTLASAAAARNAVAAVRGLLRGRLTIGAEPCLGSVDLPAELAAFRTANPGVEVRLRALSTQQLLVLCHPDHRFAAETSIPIDALRGEPLVGFQEGWGAQALARRAFAAAGFDYRAAMEVNDVHPLLDLVGYNLGVAVVPQSFARKRPDQLRAVALSGDVPEWTVAVAVSDEPSPAAAAFLRQLARVEAPTQPA